MPLTDAAVLREPLSPVGSLAPEPRRRVVVATDAWRPQVNGVVRTLEGLAEEIPQLGAELAFITPDRFRSLPLPTYPEIRIALATPSAVGRALETLSPDAIHIATEGPIGYATRRYCIRQGIPFTTCYHTRFPEYVSARFPVPLSLGYEVMRRFHNAAAMTMVATPALKQELQARGFTNLGLWRRGVDVPTFSSGTATLREIPRPIFLTVCRLAVEKNIEAFLQLDLPGSKVVVGEGPARKELERRYPDAYFLGAAHGRRLADIYQSADVFVFPSRTDTYGLVMLEALAAGAPVAAFPVSGPCEIVGASECGVLDEDLRKAALAALEIPRERCREFGARHTMAESARSFLNNIAEALASRRGVRASRFKVNVGEAGVC